MKESSYYPKYEKWIKESYPKAYIRRISDRFRVGIPDFLLSVDGKFVGIEVKDKKTKIRNIQKEDLLDIANSGGHGLIGRCYGVRSILDPDKLWDIQTTTLKEIVEELNDIQSYNRKK